MKHRVYVYGTLRLGGNHYYYVRGKMYNIGWFPGVILGEGGGMVVCEVLEVDDEGLARLDQLEGYYENSPENSLYIRREHNDGWIYEYNKEVDPDSLIKNGNWLTFTDQSRGSNSALSESVTKVKEVEAL